ncbi:MAG: hypothetical protein EOP86_13210 [Verrucomicrobiaceae bacterium]|nr:MAG: hypothetical protein EOP86_13210 [Verrucomicrobiaceae bacterium]
MKCRLLRFRISSRLDDGRSLPPPLERHLAHCPECATWHRAQLSLIHRLRHSALPAAATAAALAEPPSALQANVMRAIRQAQPSQQRLAGFSFFNSWLPAAGMTAALLAAGALVLTLNRKQPNGHADISQQTTEVQAGNSSTSPSAAAGTTQVSPSAGTAHEAPHDGRNHWIQTAAVSLDTPLRREFALLNEDARSAVRALRASFLPASL